MNEYKILKDLAGLERCKIIMDNDLEILKKAINDVISMEGVNDEQ